MTLTANKAVLDWIEEMRALVKPQSVMWIDGSEEQLEELRREGMIRRSFPAATTTGAR